MERVSLKLLRYQKKPIAAVMKGTAFFTNDEFQREFDAVKRIPPFGLAGDQTPINTLFLGLQTYCCGKNNQYL